MRQRREEGDRYHAAAALDAAADVVCPVKPRLPRHVDVRVSISMAMPGVVRDRDRSGEADIGERQSFMMSHGVVELAMRINLHARRCQQSTAFGRFIVRFCPPDFACRILIYRTKSVQLLFSKYYAAICALRLQA